VEALESLLFGDGADAAAALGGEPDAGAGDGGAAFVVDAAPRRATRAAATAAAWTDPYVQAAVVDVANGARRARKLREAEAEAELTGGEYEARLRARFASTHRASAGWANAARAARREGGGASVASGAPLLASGALATPGAPVPAPPPRRLAVTRLADVPGDAPAADAVVRSVAFHPGGQILLTASMDRRVRFVAADGAQNATLQTLFLRDMQVHQAGFAQGGRVAVAAGRRRFIYVFDLAAARAERVRPPAGRGERSFERFAACDADSGDTLALLGDRGSVSLLSLKSRCAAGDLSIPGTVRAAAFDASGTTLFAGGGDGVVHAFDLRTRRCIWRAADDGGLGVASLAAAGGPSGGSLAVGSGSGVVNVYRRGADGGLEGLEAAAAGGDADTSNLTPRPPARPAPARALTNLTTVADTLAWSAGGELLVCASRMARDALRAVDGPSLAVYANWPSSRTPLGHVHAAAVSPGRGLLAFGNAKGKCLLYRVHHLPI